MRLFYTLVMLVVSYSAIGQLVLEGKITDATDGSPVIGASVYLPDLKKGAVTNEEGEYKIEDLSRGRFLVEVKYIGYASHVQRVEIKNSMTLNINLSTTITELNEVVISGLSHSTELKKNPVPVATLSSEALHKNSSSNIIDNISQKPGISQISTGAAISKPVIRGLGYNRIITLYDGIRQEGQQWGDEHGIEIDEFSVDRVEIIKGAGSLMYGSDGIGGVINFLAPNPLQEGKIEGQWISNYQSNNGLIANSVNNSGNIKGLYWSLRASQKIAKAYQNAYDGKVLNSGFRENNFNVLAGLNKSWGYTQFTLSSFNQHVGLVEGERDPEGNFILLKNSNGVEEESKATKRELNSYSLHIPNQRINHVRFSNSTNIYWGNIRTQVNIGYQQNKRKEFGNVLVENEAELFFDLSTANASGIVYFPEIKAWNFSLGVNGQWQRNVNRGEEFLIPEYSLQDQGIVAFTKKSFNKLDLSAGLRFDHRNITIHSLNLDAEGRPTADPESTQKFASAHLDFSNYSASAGITYQFSDILTAKVNMSRGYRAPNIAELASNGRHEGSLRYEYGSYDLKAENSFQTDISFLLNSPHISAEIAIYQNTINNYIFVKKLLAKDGTDSIADPEEPVPAYAFTQGKARLTGGELSIDLHPHPLDWLHFENSFSLVHTENISAVSDSARYLPFTPAPRLQTEVRADVKRWKKFSHIFFKIQHQFYGEQNNVFLENRTETVTPSYSLWHTGIGLDLMNTRFKKVLSFYFTINNVFNKAYQHHLSRLKYAPENASTGRTGVFNMGRNFSIKLILPISIKK